jgi:hypothetical protein
LLLLISSGQSAIAWENFMDRLNPQIESQEKEAEAPKFLRKFDTWLLRFKLGLVWERYFAFRFAAFMYSCTVIVGSLVFNVQQLDWGARIATAVIGVPVWYTILYAFAQFRFMRTWMLYGAYFFFWIGIPACIIKILELVINN